METHSDLVTGLDIWALAQNGANLFASPGASIATLLVAFYSVDFREYCIPLHSHFSHFPLQYKWLVVVTTPLSDKLFAPRRI
jgi:hypothetical protein